MLTGSRPRKWCMRLALSLGFTGLSKSQVSAVAAELDELVEGFRSRPRWTSARSRGWMR